jgi:hypothetical protein
MDHDPVNHPFHYTHSGGVECIEAIESSMNAEAYKGFLKGNVLKYVWRYENKKGAEDLKKAQWYLDRLIALREAEEATVVQIKEASKDVIKALANYDPDDYMISGCPDGFCPIPNVRQGPSETMFQPI